MTKLQLEIAQFALITYQRAHQLSEKHSPARLVRNRWERAPHEDITRPLGMIAGAAKALYWTLTGRWPDMKTDLWDLSTETPARWAQERKVVP